MILEVAVLNLKKGMTTEFENNFEKASSIIASMPGYLNHELKKCLEIPNQYILLVNWETLEGHEEGFRRAAEDQEW